jgi:hypothetical protein
MKKIILFSLALLMVGFVAVAQADPVNPNTWYGFNFGAAISDAFAGPSGINYSSAPDAPWTFTSIGGARVTITDGFIEGDIFTLYDNGNAIGSTTFVVNTGTDSGATDPVTALTIPGLSHGFFSLGPGSHSLIIQIVQNATGYPNGGTAWFEVQNCTCPAPLPTTSLLLGSGLLGLAGLRLRRKN